MKLGHWLVVIFAVATLIILALLRRHTRTKFSKLVAQHDMLALDEFCKTKMAMWTIPPFNMEYGKMTVYLLNGQEKAAIRQFDKLLEMRKSKSQDLAITMKAFRYFVSINDKKRATEMFEKIKEMGNDTQIHESTIMYDVYVMHKANHIDEILTRYEECQDAGYRTFAEMLSIMYKSKGDKEKAEKYKLVAEGKAERDNTKSSVNLSEDVVDEEEKEGME